VPGSDPIEIALVLGAGRGTRMGGPKALMDVGGAPWWMHQRDRLVRARMPSVWVVSDAVCEVMGDDLRPPLRMVFGDPTAPMMASICAGILELAREKPAAVHILPIDTPAPSADVWRAVRTTGAAPTAPAHAGKRGHPIRLPWAFIERSILPHLSDVSWRAGARLDHIVAPELIAVPVDDPDVAVNLNTRDDLDRWMAGRDRVS